MKITKTHTVAFTITGINHNFTTFNETYKRIRKDFRNPMFHCFSCGKQFENDEVLALAFTDKGNKILCEPCAKGVEDEALQERLGGTK